MSNSIPSVPSESPAAADVSTENVGSLDSGASEGDVQTVESALEDAEQNQAAGNTPKTYKLKIDGEEVEVSEDELLSGYQTRKASQKRFEDAAKLRKEAEQTLEYLKKYPSQALEKLGFNVRELAENYIAEQLDLESMTPEQKRIREYEQKLRAYEDREKGIADQKAQEEAARLRTHYEQDYSTKIQEALQTANLPKTPYTVKRMAQLMSQALEQGYDVNPKDIVHIVKEDYINDFKQLWGASDGDTLINILGKDVADKIRKTQLAKVNAKTVINPLATRPVASAAHEAPKSKNKMSMAEFRESMKNLTK